jgi:hypothetical protein
MCRLGARGLVTAVSVTRILAIGILVIGFLWLELSDWDNVFKQDAKVAAYQVYRFAN